MTLFTSIFFLFLKGYTQIAIQTDRPDQTECPFITPKGFLQVKMVLYMKRLM